MTALASGARRLPTHYLTIRVPWHDSGWNGAVCARPLEYTSCLILPRIGEGKRDEVEPRCARPALRRTDGRRPAAVDAGLHVRLRHGTPRGTRRDGRHPPIPAGQPQARTTADP